MLSRIMLARALTATLAGLSVVAASASVPAAAANETISGTIVDTGGVPIPGLRVWADGYPSSATTDAHGQFSFPVTGVSNTRLGLATPRATTGPTSAIAVYTQSFAMSGNLDIGTATLPPLLSTKTVRVVDSAGTPVYGAGMYANGGPVGTGWVDAGHQLTPQLQITSGSFSMDGGTNATGEITLGFPRLADDKLPSVPINMATGTGSVYTANLSAATGTNPHVVTISGYTVGPPTTVPPPNASTSITSSPGEAYVYWRGWDIRPNGSAITGFTITANPGGATIQVPVDVNSVTMQGLTGGVSYTFAVTAHSTAGSTTSAPSSPVTVSSPPPPSTTNPPVLTPQEPNPTLPPPTGPQVPGRVSRPAAKVKGAKAIVTWDAPNAASGGPVTRYLVAATPGKDKAVTGSTRKVVFKNLKPGKYKFTVTAMNTVGKGAASSSVRIVVRRRV